MNIIEFTSPGRFPTMVYDPGRWWDVLESKNDHSLQRFSANAAWWRTICGPATEGFRKNSPKRLFRRSVRDAATTAPGAAAALEALRRPQAYGAAAAYIQTLTPLAEHLDTLNASQNELWFSLEAGVHVVGLDYASSRALVEYARQRTLLSDLIVAALAEAPREIDLLLVRVTTPEDLLCALIAVRVLRERHPALHACLADHSFERFSLAPHMPRLRSAGTLNTIFDSIIESPEDRDVIAPALAAAGGRTLRGYLTREHVPAAEGASRAVAPPMVATFAPVAILRTMLARSTSGIDVTASIDRVVTLAAGGYGNIVFADDALPPAVIDDLRLRLTARGLSVRWSCRCATMPEATPELFRRMRESGCCEVAFAFDRSSYDQMESLLKAAGSAGVGVHAVLTIGSPGETAAEAEDAVARLSRSLRDLPGATFWLDRFTLVPGSPAMHDPAAHGVTPIDSEGDMPAAHSYWPVEAHAADTLAIEERHPELGRRLAHELGWDRLGRGPGAAAAVFLHFVSGHGTLFKARPDNPFANPLMAPAARA